MVVELVQVVNVPLIEIHVGLLADQVAVAATHALDFGQGVHDLLFAIDLVSSVLAISLTVLRTNFIAILLALAGETYVGVEETQDELEVRLLARNERHLCGVGVLSMSQRWSAVACVWISCTFAGF